MADLVLDPIVEALGKVEVRYVDGPPAPDGRPVAVRTLLARPEGAARGTVIFSPGRTEFIEKHADTAQSFLQRGYAVLMIEPRGQGLSTRLTDNPLLGHMDSFDAASTGFAAAYDAHKADLPQPHILASHSMGGAIVLDGLLRQKLSGFAGAIFCAPMWGLKLPFVARHLCAFMCQLGFEQTYAIGAARHYVPMAFDNNVLTHSSLKLARMNGLFLADPRLQLAGPSNGWGVASYQFFDTLRAEALAKIETPILVFSAGNEGLVDNASHKNVCAHVPNATHVQVAGANHEMFHEIDEYASQLWANIDSFLAQIAPQTTA